MSNKITSAIAPGTVLHGEAYDYKIIKTLGQGSFGITYQAKVEMKGALGTLDSNMYVAVKEFFMKEVNGRSGDTVTSGSTSKGGLFSYYREKFEREARNLGTLKHPNIVRVLEMFIANGTAYYAMEFINGMSLDDTITKSPLGRLSTEQAIRLTQQIGAAISFMHSRKMLHLDVKPANVMVRADGKAVLIDFGLSKQYDESGQPESSTTVGGGTPGYAPLEQASYRDGHGFPVVMDVYALGATMFKMLSGQRPPEASEILNEGFPESCLLAANTPRHIIRCIEKAMAPLKKDRYQSVDQFVMDLCGKAETTGNEAAGKNEATSFSDEVNVVDARPSDRHEAKRHNMKKLRLYICIGFITFIVFAAICTSVQNCQVEKWRQEDSIDTSLVEQPEDPSAANPTGTLYTHDAAGNNFVWTGGVLNDLPDGNGSANYNEGDKDGRKEYYGRMVKGKRETLDGETATLTYINGNKYVGTFANDMLKEGTYTDKENGMSFKGTFKNNAPYNGKWFMLGDGSVYTTVKNGEMQN
jgi:serine/threonine protein kinase